MNPKQTVAVSIKTAADFFGQIDSNRELIELLGTCTLKAVRSDLAPPENAVTATAGGCDIFVEGLIDPNAEKARLAKEIEAKKKSIEGMKARLGNESYVAKAPPKLCVRKQTSATSVGRQRGRKACGVWGRWRSGAGGSWGEICDCIAKAREVESPKVHFLFSKCC